MAEDADRRTSKQEMRVNSSSVHRVTCDSKGILHSLNRQIPAFTRMPCLPVNRHGVQLGLGKGTVIAVCEIANF